MTMLDGRVAFITGGAQGIGLAIATALGREGARVVLADMNEATAAEAATSLGEIGIDVLGIRCDVTSTVEVEAAIANAQHTFGRIDVLVNNAGITRDATMRNMSETDFRSVIDVHLTGAWLCTKHVAPAMRQQGSGAIINISSIAGKVGNFGQTNYSAAKAGLIGLTKASAKELARAGVRVNAVQPGLIRTAMTEAMPADAWAQKMAEIPMQRAGEPQEVASAVLFLASDMSSYITGSVLEVTGGRHM